MKDEMKSTEEVQGSQRPSVGLTALLAAMMGGKGLEEMLAEVNEPEYTPEEEARGESGQKMMMELWKELVPQLRKSPLLAGPIIADFTMTVWDRFAEWGKVEFGDEYVIGGSTHCAQFYKAMGLFMKRLGDQYERLTGQPTDGCDCPRCQELRKANESTGS